METAFAHARRSRPDTFSELDLAFAGRPVRMRVVGRELVKHIGRSFDHLGSLEPSSAEVQLSIDVWDGSETGIPAPAEPAVETLGASWMAEGGLFTTSPDGRFVRYQRPECTTWLDRDASHIIGWYRSAEQLSIYERTRPFRLISYVWYHDRDVQIVHAGLVARRGRGVLLAGPGGAGKSTSALACLCAGFDYLGDDFVGLQEVDGGSFLGYSLYGSARFDPQHLANFPDVCGHAIRSDDPSEPKSLLLLSGLFPMRLKRSVRVSAIALPRVLGLPAPRIRPASSGEALLRLAPSSLLLGLSPGAPGLDRMARLVEHAPSYWLELGGEVEKIPVLLEQVLAQAERR